MQSLDDAFLTAFADDYRATVRAGQGARPCETLAAQRGAPVRTVHRWAVAARERGFLEPPDRSKVRRRPLGVTVSPSGRAAIGKLAKAEGVTVASMARTLLAEAVQARTKRQRASTRA